MPVVVAVFTVTTVLAAWVTLRSWGRRDQPPAVMVTGVIAAAMTLWSGCELTLVFTTDVDRALALRMTILFAGVVAGSAFVCLTRMAVEGAWRPGRATLALLAVEPVLLLVAMSAEPGRGSLLRGVARGPGDLTWTVEPGPLFWVNLGYTHLLVVVALVPLIRGWTRRGRRFRPTPRDVLVLVTPAVVVNALWVGGVYERVNLTVVAVVAAMVVAHRLITRRLVDFGPVAHRRVFEAVTDAVLVIDRHGRILDANPAAVGLARRLRPGLGGDLVGRRIETGPGLPPPDGPGPAEDVSTVITDAWGSGIDLQVHAAPLTDRRGGPIGWTLVGRDVTGMNREQEQLRQANLRLTSQLRTIEHLRDEQRRRAMRDPLTDLFNRRHLMDELDRALAGPSTTPLSLAIIDLDHFKRVNDEYGHPVGDQVLVGVARLLTGHLRDGDVLARHGGEEFVLMMPRTPAAEAWSVVDGLRRALVDGPPVIGQHRLRVSFSAGVATRRVGGDRSDLLRAADTALYEAKRLGRDRVIAARRPPGPGGPDRH